MSGEPRIIFLCFDLKLKGKRQILFNIRIRQIVNVSVSRSPAQPVKKHDLRYLFAIDLRDQLLPIQPIPVQVDHHLNRWIGRKNAADLSLRQIVCRVAIQHTVYHVKYACIMDYIISILVFQQLCQIISHAHNRIRNISFFRICKCFLRMGMIDQNLRHRCIFFYAKILTCKFLCIDLLRIRYRRCIYGIIISDQRLEILKFFHIYRFLLFFCFFGLCFFVFLSLFLFYCFLNDRFFCLLHGFCFCLLRHLILCVLYF